MNILKDFWSDTRGYRLLLAAMAGIAAWATVDVAHFLGII